MRKCSVSITCQSKCLYCTWFIPKYCCASRRVAHSKTAKVARIRAAFICSLLLWFQRHCFRIAPQSLYLVERPKRRMEDVNYEIEKIEQHPAALFQPFSVMHRQSRFLHLRYHMLADRSHVGIGGPARDDEVVSHVGDAAQIQQYDVVRSHVQAELGGALHSLRALACGYRWQGCGHAVQ